MEYILKKMRASFAKQSAYFVGMDNDKQRFGKIKPVYFGKDTLALFIDGVIKSDRHNLEYTYRYPVSDNLIFGKDH